jgi:hypothetical protein
MMESQGPGQMDRLGMLGKLGVRVVVRAKSPNSHYQKNWNKEPLLQEFPEHS